MKITYDKKAKAVYIYLSDKKVHHTKEISDSLFIDFDRLSRPRGIEILNIDSVELSSSPMEGL